MMVVVMTDMMNMNMNNLNNSNLCDYSGSPMLTPTPSQAGVLYTAFFSLSAAAFLCTCPEALPFLQRIMCFCPNKPGILQWIYGRKIMGNTMFSTMFFFEYQ